MIHKLRRKFILIAMVAVSLVMVLVGVSINVLNFITTDADLDSTLQMIYDNQGTVPQFHDSKPGKPLEGRFTPEAPFSTRYFVLRYKADGTLDGADMRNIAAVTQADANQYLSIALRHGEGDGYTGHYKYYIVQKEDGQYMAIFLDCYQELRTVRTFALVSLLVVAASIVQVYILVVLLSWRAIDPVVKNMEKQKQFITDSSHELKTPLTVITTSLKVLEMEVGQQKWIDKARSQADKMTELVNDLVTLSRLDEEKLPLQLNTFDISEAVSETAESFREFAAAHDHTLQLDIPGGFHYCGDEYAIRQLVSILMDNAVKYADGGTPINLRLEPAPKGILIKTCNFCTEMNPAEADKLFDRFYRADKARSRQATGGFGVGLSIARSIVEAHRGNIHAEWMEGGMLQFTAFLRA